MIQTKKDLKEYIKCDLSRNGIKSNYRNKYFTKNFFKRLLGIYSEKDYVIKYLKTLRKYEYYLNNKDRNIYYYILCKIYSVIYEKRSMKYRILIFPNKVGKGLYIPHITGGIICNCISMGDNCTITSGVIVGNKGSNENRPIIGNNVELTVGCKVIGKIRIGNNVIVAPNSVVIKDVPDEAIVSGIPASIIHYKKN